MKTLMRDTSLEAFKKLEKIGTKQAEVLQTIIQYGPVCDRQIAKILNWEINRVTGRRKELIDMHMVRAVDKITSDTGRSAWRWESTYTPKNQLTLEL